MPLSPPFALRPCLALLLLSPSLALAGNAVPLTPTTITATRTEQAVDSVPSTVSVQTREQLDRQNVNNIKELVRYEPGVSVGGAGQRAGITGYNASLRRSTGSNCPTTSSAAPTRRPTATTSIRTS